MTDCSDCGVDKKYNSKYDAYYCQRCNVWLEDKCDEPECEYCRERPENPMDEESAR